VNHPAPLMRQTDVQPISRTDLRARIRVRSRQSSLLAPALLRAVRWQPIVLSAGVAAALIWLMQRNPDAYNPFMASRIGAICLCVGASFLFDDPSEPTVGASPGPLSFRRGLRLGLGATTLALGWFGVVALAAKTPRAVYGGDVMPGVPFPMGRLSLELAALLITMLAGTVVAGRTMNQHAGGVAGGPIVLLTLALLRELPARWSMLVGPGDPAWTAAGQRWTGLLVVASIALLMLNADPGGVQLRRRLTAP
jgi:hypothetical protein